MAENLELTVSTEGMDTKNIENNLLQEKKISEESVENSLNYNSLSTEEKQAIDEFVKKIENNEYKYNNETIKNFNKIIEEWLS